MADDDGGGPAGARDGDSDARDDGQPTVAIGSEGFQPDGDAGETGDDQANAGGQTTTAGVENAVPDGDGRFDWRGWLLVALVVVCFLVLPVIVVLRPVRLIGFRTTYLLLPLIPAFLLGATAVWVAVRSRQG